MQPTPRRRSPRPCPGGPTEGCCWAGAPNVPSRGPEGLASRQYALMTEALDARHFGLGALAAAVGYAVVLFIDATLLACLLVWLSWMLLVSAVCYFAMPPWREVPARKALAGRILVAEASAVVVLATAIRIATA